MRWDIFCTVIDNYGDIGVCWRLARQLANEHGQKVRLWVDDLDSLQQLYPEISALSEKQTCCNVEIRHWAAPFQNVDPANVVIEAFACELPQNYLQAMAQRKPAPLWINLEYLSAEGWVEGCHGLASPHPHLPLTKHFFFPGFTAKTGGLLRERDLISRRDALQKNPAELWQFLNLPLPAQEDEVVSLFCYDTAPIADLLDTWAAAASPVCCLLPESKVLACVAAYFGKAVPGPGTTLQRGKLTLHVLPFLRQEDYDRLLWACDCNFVRGEDSFVRAQWAAKPLVWQIYPQNESAHLIKLDAFLDRYCSGLDVAAANALRTFHQQWNGSGKPDWDMLAQHRTMLQDHAAKWAAYEASQPDLASNLVEFHIQNK